MGFLQKALLCRSSGHLDVKALLSLERRFCAARRCLLLLSLTLTPFKLEVDASALGAGTVLLQEDEQDIDHPICYFSKKFNKHQTQYSTIEKETLSLLLALQHFEAYLSSSFQPVAVYTDHNPFVFFSTDVERKPEAHEVVLANSRFPP